jgi:hypothetical protein
MPTLQYVALACANKRFPDMKFCEDPGPFKLSKAGLWSIEMFLSSKTHGNSKGQVSRYCFYEDSCCIVISNRIEDTSDPDCPSVIILEFMNPEYTAPRFRRAS